MKTIYHVTENHKEFVCLTHPLALENLANLIGAKLVIYDYADFSQRKIEKDSSNDILWIIEAAYPQMSNMSIKELKTFYPNAKIVVIGGDTIFFLRQGKHHIEGLEEVDLWLDLMDEVVVFYKKLGIVTDHWMWTASETILNKFDEYTKDLPVDFSIKDVDVNCFMGMHSSYRTDMARHFQEKGLTFAVGSGCEAKNFSAMIDVYRRSHFTLGSTSPSWTTGQRTMKGFRDWLGPALNSLLIYDDFPDIRQKFGGGSIVPLYNYNNYESITYLMDTLRKDPDLYKYMLTLQKHWLRYNTLEKQFVRKLTKHGILPMEVRNEKVLS